MVELKEELQKRKLPYAGKKDELVARLAAAMELEASQTKAKKTALKRDSLACLKDSNYKTRLREQPPQIIAYRQFLWKPLSSKVATNQEIYE